MERRPLYVSLRASRWITLALAGLVVLLHLMMGAARAHAEGSTVTSGSTLRARPSAGARAVGKVYAGDRVTVIASEGTWSKVRASGRTGWIPSRSISRKASRREARDLERAIASRLSEEDEEDDDAAARRRRREREREREEAEAREREEEEAAAREREEAEAREREEEEAAARAAARREREREEEEAREREADERAARRRSRSRGRVARRDDDGTDESPFERADDGADEDDAPIGKRWSATIRLAGGLAYMGQSLTSLGGSVGVPDNYTLGAGAMAASAHVEVLRAVTSRRAAGGVVSFGYGRGLSGLQYMNVQTPFSSMTLDVAATGAQQFADGVVRGLARIGYHERRVDIEGGTNAAANPALLPSESLRAVQLGASVEVPRLTPTLGLRLDVDLLPLAWLVQTPGLEDGASSSSSGAHLRAALRYQWKTHVAVEFGYDQDRVKTEFLGDAPGSMRAHGGAGTTRTDVTHTFSTALTTAF